MLPSHRHLITTLITTLSHPATDDSLNRRKLLLTLHVIFPRILLPALDLLDRNLVTEYTQTPQHSTLNTASPSTSTNQQSRTQPNTSPRIHLVRSLATTLKHRKESKIYLVNIDAWNCSCEGFVLEAFSGAGVGDAVEIDSDWSFGGLSSERSGAVGERLPCCKHLLACLLADKWEAFATNITRKECTINEMAGLVAGI